MGKLNIKQTRKYKFKWHQKTIMKRMKIRREDPESISQEFKRDLESVQHVRETKNQKYLYINLKLNQLKQQMLKANWLWQ